MKKVLIVSLCLFIVFSMTACKRSNTESESAISSDVFNDGTLVSSKSQSKPSVAVTENTTVTTIKNTTSHTTERSHTTQSSPIKETSKTTENFRIQDSSYEDIVCVKTLDFQQVSFSMQDSNVLIWITIPKQWKLEKSKNGYSIVKGSQPIGSITTSKKTNEAVNVFSGDITVANIKITHNIDRIDSDEGSSYTRTLCYDYDDERGNHKSIVVTVPYIEIDSSAICEMMTQVKKSYSFAGKNMGVLQIQDNRNKVLILGNSFVNTSSIGSILQEMCGSDVSVEAHSRGYASISTYVQDAHMMQNIRAGSYSAVLMCGLYSHIDVLELSNIVNACQKSNTKLAIFPAHNESRLQIDDALLMYPSVVLVDWKAEIDALISTGVDYSDFCIADSHKHSTPLAGYVGAHMVYRAIFNKIPQTTSFSQVSKSQIARLGDYVTSGSIVLFDESLVFSIE